MKTLLAAAAAALVVCITISSPVHASVHWATSGNTVTLYDNAGGNGGIFEVDVTPGTSTGVPYFYGSVTHFDFQTFCVQLNETIQFGVPYTVLNSNATQTAGSTPTKTLGSFAAWLYTEFLKPTLGLGAGITGNSFWSSNLAENANAIQYGIWKSMGWSDGGGPINGASGAFGGQLGAYNDDLLLDLHAKYLLDTPWSGLGAYDTTTWNRGTTIGSVRIMNLAVLNTDGSTRSNHQDQLVWSPPPGGSLPQVPEPMSFLVWSLLAMCAGSVSISRRRT